VDHGYQGETRQYLIDDANDRAREELGRLRSQIEVPPLYRLGPSRPLAPTQPVTFAHGTLDVETFSAAGYVWDEERQRYVGPPGSSQGKKGLPVIGAAAYAEHPSTDILLLRWRLPHPTSGGLGAMQRWQPGEPNPQALFDYLAAGGVLEFHNRMFEYLIWYFQLTPRYGWPLIPFYQTRCSMATARVNSYPGALGNLGDVLHLEVRKNADGKRLLDKWSMPRNPTKKDPRHRVLPPWMPGYDPADAEDWAKLGGYCDDDVDTEVGASQRMRPMDPDELMAWWIDQEINFRGLGVDRAGVRACIVILNQALERYGAEFNALTGLDPTQLEKFKGWLAAYGVHLPTMDEDAITAALKKPMHPSAWRALTIRQLVGSASVKKLFAIENSANSDDRVRNLLVHHGTRPGRPSGDGAQPLNMPKAGPKLVTCAPCDRPYKPALSNCPWCGATDRKTGKGGAVLSPRWTPEMADHVLEIMASGELDVVEYFFGSAMLAISGCLRSLFVAAPGKDFIASDYSSLQAVVLAQLAGEQWRIDAFHNNEPIYLLGASKITGKPLQFYLDYNTLNGEHHEDRQYIGKVSELALGFQGWIGAWRAMEEQQGIVSPFTDDDIKRFVLAWRDENPAIVEFWGGQHRGRPWDRDRRQEYFGVEGAAIQAILYPGQVFDVRGIKFFVETTPAGTPALIIQLLPTRADVPGRRLTYHQPSLYPSTRDPSEYAITYWNWNSNPKYGPMGWGPMGTWGGRLTENIVMGHEVDIMRFATLNLRAAGYPMVLPVYDEAVVEVPHGTGSIEEVERLMQIMPLFAEGWPVRAAGGWRGRRYRKAA
jgi:DNA polymerase